MVAILRGAMVVAVALAFGCGGKKQSCADACFETAYVPCSKRCDSSSPELKVSCQSACTVAQSRCVEGCRASTVAAGDVSCRAAVTHLADLLMKTPDLPETIRKTARDQLDRDVEQCERDKPSTAYLRCMLAATSLADAASCITTHKRAGSGDGGAALEGGAAPAGAITCRDAVTHTAEVYADLPDVSAADKQQVRDGLEDGIAACEREQPSQEVLRCTMAATSLDAMKRCDAMRGP